MISTTNLENTEILQDKILEIFKTDFFMSHKRFSLIQEQYALIQYFYYVKAFPSFLVTVLEKCQTDIERLPLIKNLWEEHGEGHLEQSHRELYRSMLNSIIPEKNWISVKEGMAVNKAIQKTSAFLKKSNLNDCMIFLGYGIEYVTPMLYKKFLEKISKIKEVKEFNDSFFTQHILDDHEHFGSLTAMSSFSLLPFESAIEIEKTFWNSLTREMENLNE